MDAHCFRILTKSRAWESTQVILKLIQCIHSNSLSQNHYSLLSAILERLDQDSPQNLSPGARFTLLSCLSFMALQGGSALTLANLELLDTFMNHLNSSQPSQQASDLIISSIGRFHSWFI